MSLHSPIPLMDVHGELGSLLYAVQSGLGDLGVTVSISYNQYTYLSVSIEIWPMAHLEDTMKKIEAVVARLQQGILQDEYDYRFRGISHPVLKKQYIKALDRIEVCANVDLSHWPHRKPHGWEVSAGMNSHNRRIT